MSFHWSYFIIPSRLEICLFIAILVCLSLFYLVYVNIYIYIYKCAHVCIQYQYSLSTYMDL